MVNVAEMAETTSQIVVNQPEPTPKAEIERGMIEIEQLDFKYGAHQVLHDVNLSIPERAVTAFIGPSGCGKTTLLRCLNRMNDLIDGTRVEGDVLLDGNDILGPKVDVVELRKRVGMVFQKSNPFPKSVFENVAYGPRVLPSANSQFRRPGSVPVPT